MIENLIQEIEKDLNNNNLLYKAPKMEDAIMDQPTPLGQKYKKAKEICKGVISIDLRTKYEKDTDKAIKSKDKKIPAKPKRAAMAKVQKEP